MTDLIVAKCWTVGCLNKQVNIYRHMCVRCLDREFISELLDAGRITPEEAAQAISEGVLPLLRILSAEGRTVPPEPIPIIEEQETIEVRV